MGIEQVRDTLRERIKRGASFEELETVIRLARGLRERERWELWNWAWRYDPEAKTPGRFRTAERGLGAALRACLRRS